MASKYSWYKDAKAANLKWRGRRRNQGVRGFTKRYTRNRRHKNFGNRQTATIIRAPSAITDTTMVCLKYSQAITLASISTPGLYQFRGNSVYDPDVTGTGHQPLGHDQWSAFYKSYVVLGCGYKITLIGDGSNTVLGAVVCKPNSDAISNFDTIKERAYDNTCVLGLQGSNKHIQTLSGYMSTKKMFGLHGVDAADSDYTAGVTGDPVNQWFIQAYSQAQDRATSLSTVGEVTLTYYVKYFNRNNLLQS